MGMVPPWPQSWERAPQERLSKQALHTDSTCPSSAPQSPLRWVHDGPSDLPISAALLCTSFCFPLSYQPIYRACGYIQYSAVNRPHVQYIDTSICAQVHLQANGKLVQGGSVEGVTEALQSQHRNTVLEDWSNFFFHMCTVLFAFGVARYIDYSGS